MTRFNMAKLLSILVGLSISLSGCAKSINNKANLVKDKKIVVENISSNEMMPEDTIIEHNQESNQYVDYLNNLEFTFNHEDYYYDLEYLNSLIEKNKELKDCTYKFNSEISPIVESIKNNTKEVVANHSEYTDPFLQNLSIYQNVVYSCLKNIEDNGKNDLNSDFHQISNMAIVFGNFSNFKDNEDIWTAVYEDDLNIIVINQKRFESLIETYDYPYEKFLYYIISHEMNHVRENVCPCNRDYEYSNLDYSADYTFLLESSAESDLYNSRDLDDILVTFDYSDERKSEGELFLLNILSSEGTDEYYNAIFDVDYESLFTYFNLQTDEEKFELFQIIQSMDARFSRNAIVEKIYGNAQYTYNDLVKEIGLTYKELLFKKCMINLINYTDAHTDFSLQENLVILNIIKSYLIDDTYSYKEGSNTIERVYDKETINNIKDMEEVYIEYLAFKYGITVSDIREYESIEVKAVLEAIFAIISGNDADYGNYTKFAHGIMDKFPMIRAILMANPDYSYNTYSSRILELPR